MQKVKIISNGNPANTHTYIDDTEIKGVQSIDYYVDVYGKSVLKIQIVGAELELYGNFKDTEIKDSSKRCMCDLNVLTAKGCQCGGN